VKSTLSGTLSPNDWTGGCENARYRINATVYPVGLGVDNEFGSTASGYKVSNVASFICNGS
jgi:hypothetical protein